MEKEIKSEETNRLKEAEQMVKKFNEDTELSQAEDLIKDNKYYFTYNAIKYRIKLLDSSDKEELDSLRRKKFNSMLQEKDENGNYVYLTGKKIIEIAEARGDLNVKEIDEKIKVLEAQELDLQLKLGESLSKKEPETILKTYKEQIDELRLQKYILSTQKSLLLEFSLENQLLGYVAKIMTWLSLERLEGEIWQRAFKILEDFDKCKDDTLIEKAAKIAIKLQYGI